MGSLLPSLGFGPILFVVKIPISGISSAIFFNTETFVVTIPEGIVNLPLISLVPSFIAVKLVFQLLLVETLVLWLWQSLLLVDVMSSVALGDLKV